MLFLDKIWKDVTPIILQSAFNILSIIP